MTTRHPAIDDLLGRLGVAGLIVDPADCARYAADLSGEPGAVPVAVLRPADTDAVADALRICRRHGLPIVPQGGRTGLSGGAVCLEGNAVLSLERMSGVIAVDPDAMTMCVWAGTPLQTVQERARAVGLDYPVDIGSRGSATIGGTIATNAGGIRVVRHGMTRQHILGLEVVLPDGTVLDGLGELLKDNAGYDLKHLFIGSEGTLGIVTRAILRLVPATVRTNTALLGLAGFDTALSLLTSARRHFGADLVAFEGMWPSYWDFVCGEARLARSPLAGRHGIYALVETAHDRSDGEAAFEGWLGEQLQAGRVEDGVIAQSLAETRAIWSVREAVGDVDPALGPHVNFDLGIAPRLLGRFVEACDAALGRLGVRRSLHLGHIGDGNLHLLVATGHEQPCSAHAIETAVYGLVEEWSGTVTAEHGVGTIKRQWLARCRTENQLAAMRQLKGLFDPDGLLNPGKVV
ncbi:FAD-binding oxidoreductase [Prosthecomicrobium hirschii]|nr:FAD-binding oxidoreductase [Prosthecomicrobium hirschii]